MTARGSRKDLTFLSPHLAGCWFLCHVDIRNFFEFDLTNWANWPDVFLSDEIEKTLWVEN